MKTMTPIMLLVAMISAGLGGSVDVANYSQTINGLTVDRLVEISNPQQITSLLKQLQGDSLSLAEQYHLYRLSKSEEGEMLGVTSPIDKELAGYVDLVKDMIHHNLTVKEAKNKNEHHEYGMILRFKELPANTSSSVAFLQHALDMCVADDSQLVLNGNERGIDEYVDSMRVRCKDEYLISFIGSICRPYPTINPIFEVEIRSPGSKVRESDYDNIFKDIIELYLMDERFLYDYEGPSYVKRKRWYEYTDEHIDGLELTQEEKQLLHQFIQENSGKKPRAAYCRGFSILEKAYSNNRFTNLVLSRLASAPRWTGSIGSMRSLSWTVVCSTLSSEIYCTSSPCIRAGRGSPKSK